MYFRSNIRSFLSGFLQLAFRFARCISLQALFCYRAVGSARSFQFRFSGTIIACLTIHHSNIDLADLVREISTGPDSFFKVGQTEFFVRAMSVVVVESPAQQ